MDVEYNGERQDTTTELGEKERKMVAAGLKKLDALTIQDTIMAELNNAAAGLIVRQLWYWHERGELGQFWIHKTRREWEEETNGFVTRARLDTAVRALKDARLIETKLGYRPRRKKSEPKVGTTYYKLNVSRVFRLVDPMASEAVEAEIAHLDPDNDEADTPDENKPTVGGKQADRRIKTSRPPADFPPPTIEYPSEYSLEDAVKCDAPTPKGKGKTSSPPSNGDDVPQPRYFENLLTEALKEREAAGEEVGTLSPPMMKKRRYGENAKAAVEGGAATVEECEAAMRRIAARSGDIWLYFDAALKDVRKEKSGAGRRGSPPDLVQAYRVSGMDRAAAVAERVDLTRYESVEAIPFNVWRDMAGSESEWKHIGLRVFRYVEDERRRAEKRETAA